MKVERYLCDRCRHERSDSPFIPRDLFESMVNKIHLETGEQAGHDETETIVEELHLCKVCTQIVLAQLISRLGDWKAQKNFGLQMGIIE